MQDDARIADLDNAKRRAATVSLAYNVSLSVVKLVAALLTGSIALLSEAIHSSVDVIASALAHFGVRAASAPPDDEHPYGHGKIESLAGFGEAILLVLTVLFIAYESISRFRAPQPVVMIDLALAVMSLSVVTSLLVGRHVLAVALATRSPALQSNGLHLMADFWTSVGVLAALFGTRLTGWTWLDPAAGIAVACWIAYGAGRQSVASFQHLMDRRLPDEDVEMIRRLIAEDPRVLGYHRLRSRQSGTMRYVDLHIVVPSEWSLLQAHDVADALEKRIATELMPAHVVIHVDPFDASKSEADGNQVPSGSKSPHAEP